MLLQDTFCPCLFLTSDLLPTAPVFDSGVYEVLKSLRTPISFRRYGVPVFLLRFGSLTLLPVAVNVFNLGVWQK
jgi:hypothetical protein